MRRARKIRFGSASTVGHFLWRSYTRETEPLRRLSLNPTPAWPGSPEEASRGAARGSGSAEVSERRFGRNAAARGSPDEPQLHEVGLVHVFDGVRLFAD